jgi:selenophosphate synthase
VDETRQMLLFDAQTSGGLLMGVPQEKLSASCPALPNSISPPGWLDEVSMGRN